MHTNAILMLAAALALSGCSKKDDDAKGSTGTESKAAATKVAEPAKPESGVITVTNARYPEYSGSYDGTKAMAVKTDDSFSVIVGRDCALSCDLANDRASYFDSKKVKAACPKGFVVVIEVTDGNEAKPGKHPVRIETNGIAEDSGNLLGTGAGLEITEHTADSISGTLSFQDGEQRAAGTFKAPICKEQP